MVAKPGFVTRDIPNTNAIQMHQHCGKCIGEIKAGHPDTLGHSPESYSRLSIGFTQLGLQVWCNRHDCNVVHIDFQDQKHPANLTATK